MTQISPTPTAHVHLDERGVAWIDDTNVKVIEVALDKRAHGLSPEEISFQHYGHLSLGQIYAALSYYHDHQAMFDAEIERQLAEIDELRTQAGESPLRRRLRDSGHRP